MKYFEQEFYQKPFLAYLSSNRTIDYWLKTKDYWLRGFKHVTKRHRRSFISCRLPKIIGNRVVYRLFKTTVWHKEPNVKNRKEEKYYE